MRTARSEELFAERASFESDSCGGVTITENEVQVLRVCFAGLARGSTCQQSTMAGYDCMQTISLTVGTPVGTVNLFWVATTASEHPVSCAQVLKCTQLLQADSPCSSVNCWKPGVESRGACALLTWHLSTKQLAMIVEMRHSYQNACTVNFIVLLRRAMLVVEQTSVPMSLVVKLNFKRSTIARCAGSTSLQLAVQAPTTGMVGVAWSGSQTSPPQLSEDYDSMVGGQVSTCSRKK